jgi:hypothetical protein
MRVQSRLLTLPLAAFAVAAGTLSVAAPAQAATVSLDGVQYLTDDATGTAELDRYTLNTPAGDVVVPSTIVVDGAPYIVTTIGSSAYENDGVTSVTIADSVTTIGDSAFNGNSRLTSATLGNGVTTIGDSAFFQDALTSITIPPSVRTIGRTAFNYNQLTSVTLSEGLVSIGDNAFSQNALTSVELPMSLTTLGGSGFTNNQIASLGLGGLTEIPFNAFSNNQLTSLTIPSRVTEVGNLAFENNVIASLTLAEGLTTVGRYAFAQNALTSLTVPASVTFVGRLGFGINPALTDVTFRGAPPTITAASLVGSFSDNSPAQVLSVPQEFVGTDPGYTVPTWQGYASKIAGELPPTPVDPTPPPAPALSDPAPSAPAPSAVVGGNARQGRTLTAGTGLPAGTAATFQWKADGRSIAGATSSTFRLTQKQAARRVTVTVSSAGGRSTSARTKVVASSTPRLVVTPTRIGKRDLFTVTAVGLRDGQTFRVWLGGRRVLTGTADSRGVVDRDVRFSRATDAGERRVRVSGYDSDDDRTSTVTRTVRYLSR